MDGRPDRRNKAVFSIFFQRSVNVFYRKKQNKNPLLKLFGFR